LHYRERFRPAVGGDHVFLGVHARAGGDAHVFVATIGRPLTYPMVNGTFHFLLRFVTRGKRAAAARLLGISRNGLMIKMERLGLARTPGL
jgi:regulatory Fis family protein